MGKEKKVKGVFYVKRMKKAWRTKYDWRITKSLGR